jgi:hypothetical protein
LAEASAGERRSERRESAAELIDEPKNQANDHADHEAGDEWKVKCAVPAAMNNISRQAAEMEGKFAAQVKQCADYDENSARKEQGAPELLNRFHEGNCSAEWAPYPQRRREWHPRRARKSERDSGGGNAPNEIVLLGDGLRANGKGIENIQAEREAKGFILAVSQLALAENFHS